MAKSEATIIRVLLLRPSQSVCLWGLGGSSGSFSELLSKVEGVGLSNVDVALLRHCLISMSLRSLGPWDRISSAVKPFAFGDFASIGV